jgi:hypothetical protein
MYRSDSLNLLPLALVLAERLVLVQTYDAALSANNLPTY